MSTVNRIRIRIPISGRKLGLPNSEIDHATADAITKGITEGNGRIRDIVASLISTPKHIDDAKGLRMQFQGMILGIERVRNKLFLVSEGVPRDALGNDEQITQRQMSQITSAIRDCVLAIPLPGNDASPKKVSKYVRTIVERGGVIEKNRKFNSLVTSVQGGHTISRSEFDFAERIGYFDAKFNKTAFITGSGPGTMHAPFVGAARAYEELDLDVGERRYVGFTERGIIVAETPNSLVNELVIFPNIETRMEAFIRSAQRLRVHPGGAGTAEEIMFALAVLSHKDNRGMKYPLDLVESADSEYMKMLEKFIRSCFKDLIDHLYTIHSVSHASHYAQYLSATNRSLPRHSWNNDIYFSEEVQKPFEVTFTNMETIDLSRDQDPFMLMVNLRRLFSAIVHLTIKNTELIKSWGKDRPLIHGEHHILNAVEDFIKMLAHQKRIPHFKEGDKVYRTKED